MESLNIESVLPAPAETGPTTSSAGLSAKAKSPPLLKLANAGTLLPADPSATLPPAPVSAAALMKLHEHWVMAPVADSVTVPGVIRLPSSARSPVTFSVIPPPLADGTVGEFACASGNCVTPSVTAAVTASGCTFVSSKPSVVSNPCSA